MTAFDRDASIERRQIHEISLNVTRRLRKVLDRNRYIPASLTGEVDQTVQVITGIQRDVDQIMGALPADEALDFAILTHIMGGQRHALDLLEILEQKLDGGQSAYRRDSARVHQALLAVSREIEQDALRYASEQTVPAPMPAAQPLAYAPAPSANRTAPQQRTAPLTPAPAPAPQRVTSAIARGQPPGPKRQPKANAVSRNTAQLAATLRELATKPVPVAVTALVLGAMAVVVAQKLLAPSGAPEIQVATAEPAAPAQAPPAQQQATAQFTANVPISPRNMEQPYLVVLATRRSTEELQQDYRGFKDAYPDLLATARARVDRVQGQDKQTWYRLSLIPPKSYDDAKTLCSQLRQAGLAGCWIKAVPLQ